MPSPWGVALSLAAAAAVTELGARALASTTEEPLWWHDLFTQRKERQMAALSRRGGVDVVLIGSSQTLLGLDPQAMEDLTGLRCYNASINRGLPALSEAWLQDRVLPLLHPKTVLVGISPAEVNDNSALAEQLQLYREARVHRSGPVLSWAKSAGDHSMALRYAPLARHPRRLLSAVASAAKQPATWRWSHAPEIPGVLGSRGEGLNYLDRTYHNSPRMRHLYALQSQDFHDGGFQSGALRRIPVHNRKAGARTVFVSIPGSREYIEERFEGGRAAWNAGLEGMRALVAETGCSLIETPNTYEDEEFYADMLHLNRRGRDLVTADVSKALTALLADESTA